MSRKEDSGLELAVDGDDQPEKKKRKSSKTSAEEGGEKRKRKKTFKDLTPEQQELVRKRRREKKLREQQESGDHPAAEEEAPKKTRRTRTSSSEGAKRKTSSKKRSRKRSETVTDELEQVDLDQAPDATDVKPLARTKRKRRKPREEEAALASIGEEDNLAEEEVLDLEDSSDKLESLIRADEEAPGAPSKRERKTTSKRAGRMKPIDEEEEKKAHPMFIAAIIGIPAILVIIMAWYKFGGGGGDKPVEQPKEPKIIKTGSAVNWEEAQNKGAEAKELYQQAIKAMVADEDPDTGELKDKGPHIDRFEKAKKLVGEALDACRKMLTEYQKEQKAKNPKISSGELERKLRNSRYGAKQSDWETLQKDINFRLRNLRGGGASHGGSKGD